MSAAPNPRLEPLSVAVTLEGALDFARRLGAVALWFDGGELRMMLAARVEYVMCDVRVSRLPVPPIRANALAER